MQLQPAFHLIDREDDKLFPTKAQSSQSNILFVAFVSLWDTIPLINIIDQLRNKLYLVI